MPIIQQQLVTPWIFFLGSSIGLEWWLCSQSAAQKEISRGKTGVESSSSKGWRVERERCIKCRSCTRKTRRHRAGQENQISWTRLVGCMIMLIVLQCVQPVNSLYDFHTLSNRKVLRIKKFINIEILSRSTCTTKILKTKVKGNVWH